MDVKAAYFLFGFLAVSKWRSPLFPQRGSDHIQYQCAVELGGVGLTSPLPTFRSLSVPEPHTSNYLLRNTPYTGFGKLCSCAVGISVLCTVVLA